MTDDELNAEIAKLSGWWTSKLNNFNHTEWHDPTGRLHRRPPDYSGGSQELYQLLTDKQVALHTKHARLLAWTLYEVLKHEGGEDA